MDDSSLLTYEEVLKKLISFNTISCNSNIELIHYLQSILNEQGFETALHYNDDKNKANLIASAGPKIKGGILLAGHTDVVPVEGQPWQSDPFELLKTDDRYLGRGTSDMKGFIALLIDVISTIELSKLSKPIYLIFTYDEEVGCHGAKRIESELKEISQYLDFALIGEPTNFKLVNAHKGLQATTTSFKGKPAHSSCPHLGQNAIMAAVDFVSQLSTIMPSETDQRFNPSHSTFNTGTIHGGNALNIIAEHCQLQWEYRPLPQVDTDKMNTDLHKLSHEVENRTRVSVHNDIKSQVPGLRPDKNTAHIDLLKQCLPDNIELTTAPFVTEAGIFQKASIPTLVFGPGELEQAHQPNESISIKDMESYKTFLIKLLRHYITK